MEDSAPRKIVKKVRRRQKSEPRYRHLLILLLLLSMLFLPGGSGTIATAEEPLPRFSPEQYVAGPWVVPQREGSEFDPHQMFDGLAVPLHPPLVATVPNPRFYRPLPKVAIPEPGSASLLLIAALAFSLPRKRR